MEMNLSEIIGCCDMSGLYTFRVAVKLKEKISANCLEIAVNTVIKRYPYFSVELRTDGDGYEVVPNARPIVVHKDEEHIELCSEQANFHIQTVSYEGHTIYFNVHHAFTDAMGYMKQIKSVLYCYITEMYHIELSTVGVRTADTRMRIGELEDPLYDLETADSPLSDISDAPVLRIDADKYGYEKKKTVYPIQIDESSFMVYSQERDGSPASMAAAFMYRAAANVHAEDKSDIVCAMAHNTRHAVGAFKSYRNMSEDIPVRYLAKMRTWDIDRLATATRGRVLLQTQAENVRGMLYEKKKLTEEVLSKKTLDEKREAASDIMKKAYSGSTYRVSYVGKVYFGDMEPYIDSVYTYADTMGAGILIQINVINNRFCIAFIQDFENDIYVKEFVRLLEEAGIKCETGEPFENVIPRISIHRRENGV